MPDFQAIAKGLRECGKMYTKAYRCRDCYDHGTVAVMRWDTRYDRWVPEWFRCDCDRGMVEVRTDEGPKRCPKLPKSKSDAQGWYSRDYVGAKVVRRDGKLVFFDSSQVLLLELALNDKRVHCPVHHELSPEVFESVQWLRDDLISEDWCRVYEGRPTEEEEFFA